MVAVALAVVVAAFGAWFHGAGSALAPDVVRVPSGLGSTKGNSATGYWITSNVQTTVLNWPSDPTGGTNLPAVGTPCSNTSLLPGQVTTKVIIKSLLNRKCQ